MTRAPAVVLSLLALPALAQHIRSTPPPITSSSAVSVSSVTASSYVQTPEVRGPSGTARLSIPSAGSTTVKGAAADGATAVGVVIDNSATLSNASAKLVSVKNNGTEKASIDKDGGYTVAGAGNVTVQSGNKLCLDSSCTLNINESFGNIVLNGAATIVAQTFKPSRIAIGTCSSGVEGEIVQDNTAGGTGTSHRTRICACTSDGAASPAYAWRNLGTGTVGTSTTCSD